MKIASQNEIVDKVYSSRSSSSGVLKRNLRSVSDYRNIVDPVSVGI